MTLYEFNFFKLKKNIYVIFFELSLAFTLSKPSSFSCFERLYNHMGAEKHPTVGSSGESWSIYESLNQRCAEMIDS